MSDLIDDLVLAHLADPARFDGLLRVATSLPQPWRDVLSLAGPETPRPTLQAQLLAPDTFRLLSLSIDQNRAWYAHWSVILHAFTTNQYHQESRDAHGSVTPNGRLVTNPDQRHAPSLTELLPTGEFAENHDPQVEASFTPTSVVITCAACGRVRKVALWDGEAITGKVPVLQSTERACLHASAAREGCPHVNGPWRHVFSREDP